ncbi:MAG: GAF domain-containing protein [Chloroflexota bacterium]
MPLFINLSLQKRIGLLVAAALLVGLGLFSWLGLQSLKENTQRTLDQRLAIARIMANNLDGTLTHVISQMENTASIYRELPTEAEFNQVTSSLRRIFASSQVSVPNIIMADSNGRVLAVEPDDYQIINTDMSSYPEVRHTLKAGVTTISNLINNPLMGSRVVLATTPIFNENGDVIGLLVSSIDIERSNLDVFDYGIQVGSTGYTEIVDGNGLVIARTEPGSPLKASEMSDHPGRFAALIKEGKAAVSTCHRCHETTQSEIQRRRDVLAFAPLSFAPWGVAIRQSEEEALAPTQQLERQLILLGSIVLVGTLLLAWAIIRSIVRPIKVLTSAAMKVAAGDFKAAKPTTRRDEIGQLSNAFYEMTRDLAYSRDELVARNEELSALNSIAVSVSESLNLTDVLEKAFHKVLEVTRATTGCVFLGDNEDNQLKLMFCTGTADIFKCRESVLNTARCACHQVWQQRQTLMVNHASQCPRLSKETMRDDISGFVCVPLKTKNRTLGIMNVACSGDNYFTEHDFRLLDSIGYHIGLAIENSILYEEAKQKEQLRGQLLASAITAQEDERKRISRELHDEFGQTLTGLIMSIESMADMVTPEQTKLKGKLGNAKSLVTRALEDIRRLTLDLRPSALDDLGLVTAIRTYAQTHLENRGIKVKFESKGFGERLSPVVETSVFRIVQEAINNIIKHAGANNVRIQLTSSEGKVTAGVEDDGKGFDVAAVLRSHTGTDSLGLVGIQERTMLLGGTFTIKSWPGKSTYLRVEIPTTTAPREVSLGAI